MHLRLVHPFAFIFMIQILINNTFILQQLLDFIIGRGCAQKEILISILVFLIIFNFFLL